jgi:hypothetical protein
MDVPKWGSGKRGYERHEDEDGDVWDWALCEVPECKNNVCIGMSERYCWPHLMSGCADISARIEREKVEQ